MEIGQAINMAICAVTMDRMLDMKTKQEIHEALAEAERLADIGKATEEFINSHDCVMGINQWVDSEAEEEGTYATTIDCIDDLLAWAELNGEGPDIDETESEVN